MEQYSFHKFGNNTMRHSSNNGSNWHTITFPDGNYTYSDLTNFISNYLECQNIDKDGIQIYYVSSLKKCFMELKKNFQVDFRSNLEFGKLIGFNNNNNNNIVTTSSFSTITPNITNSIDNFRIRGPNIISSSNYNSFQNYSVLYMFSTSDIRIGYTFKITPKNLIYHKINTNNIKKLNIQIKDGLDRPIDLKDTEISMALFLRSF